MKIFALLLSGLWFCVFSASGLAADEEKPYQVDCSSTPCKVELKIYRAYRAYSSNCLRCHGEDGVGSSFAPSLLERMKEIDKPRFMDSVTNGYTGQVGVMPAWGENPNVMKHIDGLYAYLRALSDGALKGGKPERMK